MDLTLRLRLKKLYRLRNVLDRAIYVAAAGGEREVRLVDMPVSPTPIGRQPAPFPAFEPAKSYRKIRTDFERRYVSWLLDRHAGNINAEAREAKMGREHLYDLAQARPARRSRLRRAAKEPARCLERRSDRSAALRSPARSDRAGVGVAGPRHEARHGRFSGVALHHARGDEAVHCLDVGAPAVA